MISIAIFSLNAGAEGVDRFSDIVGFYSCELCAVFRAMFAEFKECRVLSFKEFWVRGYQVRDVEAFELCGDVLAVAVG